MENKRQFGANQMQRIEEATNRLAWHMQVAKESGSHLSFAIVLMELETIRNAFDNIDNLCVIKDA
jgi:hypothetical protein